jgi:Ca2+-binding RTX toxin-like protein
MSDSVTIPGAGTATITGSFDNTANLQLAKQIRDALVFASHNAGLTVSVAGSTTVPPPSNTTPGALNELVINAGGDYTIPAGSGGAPNYIVVIKPDINERVTIHGAPNSTVLGGNPNVTIVNSAAIALDEAAINASVTLNGAGDVLAGNNNNDTLTAAGVAESISGGATGSNLLIATGSNDTISAHGHFDTIRGGGGQLTVQIAATAASELVLGGGATLFVTDSAFNFNADIGDTIFGGDGGLNVTTSGAFARVIGGELGGIRALDTGTSDTIFAGGGGMLVTDKSTGSNTITAGSGSTSVTSAIKSFVQGGAGLLNFVGGTGNSTIMGGSGNATLTGGSGATSLFGGAGGSMIYRNIDGGGLFYQAQSGNETIDASLSAANGLYLAGRDSLGQNLIKGGSGSDAIIAGTGAATLVGGGGADFFDFFSSLGSPSVNVVIGDFSAIDNVMLISYGAGEAANAIAGATTAGGSTTITLSDHTKITFTGVTNSGALSGHIQQA